MNRTSRRAGAIRFLVGMVGVLALLGPVAVTTQPAAGYWSVASSPGSAGAARTAWLNAQSPPSAAVAGGDVALGWPASTTSTGAPVTGYSVARYDWDGRQQTIAGSCAGVLTATACTDAAVPPGNWSYAVTPRYQNWTGLAGTASANVGGGAPTVTLSGDLSVTSDSFADSSAKQPRWHSIPGSRLVMARGAGTPIDNQLTLGMGAYFATGPLALDGILRTTIGPVAGATTDATAVTSTWYPYQLGFTAAFAGPTATVVGGDLLTDANTALRYMRFSNTTPIDVTLSGTIPPGSSASWDAARKVLNVTGDGWRYAIAFAQGTVANAMSNNPIQLNEVAVVSGSTWKLVKRFNAGGNLFISLGFASASDPEGTARTRALAAVGIPTAAPIQPQIDARRAASDDLLRSVPAPRDFGIMGVNRAGTAGGEVTAAQHRAAYYRAWAFESQQTIDVQSDFAAAGFSSPQLACGKPLLIDFAPSFPSMSASCPAGSLFGMQMLSLVPGQRDQAFAAFTAYLGRVVQAGSVTGRWVSSRVAQTAWLLYQRTGDAAALAEVYPLVKDYLLFMEQNPRGNEAGVDSADQKDLEYVASWLVDAQFARKIATALGDSADAVLWAEHATTQLANLRTWFFADPGTISQFVFTDTGSHVSAGHPASSPAAIVSALAVPDLPGDLAQRLGAYFTARFTSSVGAVGFGVSSYSTSSLTATGLAGRVSGPFAYQYVNAGIRDTAFPGGFGQNVVPGGGLTQLGGYAPSGFSAAQLIAFTLLKNGYDVGGGSGDPFALTPQRPGFSTGFESGDPALSSNLGFAAPLSGVSGVTSAQVAVASEAFTAGSKAIRYSGTSVGTGSSYAYLEVFDLTGNPITVTPTTTLQYSILPQSAAASGGFASGDNSSYVAIDLVFTDGSVLRNLPLRDQRGNLIHPLYQGGTLALDSWNRVIVNLGAAASGKTITHIAIGYDHPAGPHGGYRGYIDDLSIASGPTG